eukprot:TRINITY_DN78538_c0_g1_i1.p1 TRINITY_DN78538_c0_g1~~TRINITY_DN78538_c0_g1_i1.p1  ORF type:complete len:108 (-),score=3.62 TRINITY_DN78538_c0_g1_i1:210-533(-)
MHLTSIGSIKALSNSIQGLANTTKPVRISVEAFIKWCIDIVAGNCHGRRYIIPIIWSSRIPSFTSEDCGISQSNCHEINSRCDPLRDIDVRELSMQRASDVWECVFK